MAQGHPEPNLEVWSFLKPYIEAYDATVFTMEKLVPPDLRVRWVEMIQPAIDPFGSKNMELPLDICPNAVAKCGIAMRRPLLVQVSRFDPWKDPLGVIQAYRLVKGEMPEVQLALVGALAGDDPEGYQILSQFDELSRCRDFTQSRLKNKRLWVDFVHPKLSFHAQKWQPFV
ncbi:MAG: hypothetical protein GTO12_05050 [Proteobacteria bacterium]|nr:hypothetical protein [Pseudomonadota bacterium]